MSNVISAFKRGLLTDGPLYMGLTKYPPLKIEDAMLKANAEIKWDEDKERRELTASLDKTDSVRKHPYNRNDKREGSRGGYDKKHDGRSRNYPSDHHFAMVHHMEENNQSKEEIPEPPTLEEMGLDMPAT